MDEDTKLKNEIIYYFTDMGIIMYGEFMLNNSPEWQSNCESIVDNYLNIIKNEKIKSSLLTKINHTVCCFFYHTKKADHRNEINYILSKINIDLKINYYNFLLLCNLIHYYNEYLDINEDKSLFLIDQLKKFSNLILNNEKDINNNENSITLILLFFYYYSVLLYHIFKNRPYEDYEPNAENFKEYIEQKVNNLIIKNFNDDLYRTKYDNDYIDFNLDNIIDYEQNKKFEYFIKFVKYFLSIIENRDDVQKNDFSFYKDKKLNKDIEIGLLYRKLLYLIINYNEKDIDTFEENFKNYIIENNLINNENNIINNNEVNNSNENNNNNENNRINENENAINNMNENYNSNEQTINQNNNINDENINNNNMKNQILYKIEYMNAIIDSNKNLLRFNLRNYDKFEEKIKIDINKTKNLSVHQELYHYYNISTLEKKEFENESIRGNLFLDIIYHHNKIVSLSKQYIGDKNSKTRDEILKLCEEFNDKLKNINFETDINFIKNNNYLKIIITRIFYNYLELLFIDVKKNINNDEHYEEKFKDFEEIISKYEIDNYLINKIKGDYYFTTKNLALSEKFYRNYNNATQYSTLQGLFGTGVSSYIRKKNELEEGDMNMEALNSIKYLKFHLQKEQFLIKNNISLISDVDKLINKFE